MTTHRTAPALAFSAANVCVDVFAANDDDVWPMDDTAEALRHLGADILDEPVPDYLMKMLED